MKKFFLTFAVTALVLGFTSCKETPAETTEENEGSAKETPAETPVKVEETAELHVEEVTDTTTQVTAKDSTHTSSIE